MNKKGLALFEVLAAAALGVLVFTGVSSTLYYLTIANSSARAEELVYQDMATVMERINNTTFGNLTVQYPDGQALSNSEVTNILNGYKTNGEQITVSYPNPTANPREVVATATWLDRGRQRTFSLRTVRRG